MTMFTGQTPVYKNFQWATKTERYFCKFFTKITFCPIQIVPNSKKLKTKFEKSKRFFAILGVIAIFLYLFGILIFRILILNPVSELSIWTEVSNVCGVLLVCLVILIETQLTHQHFANFLRLKQKTESDLLTLCYRDVYENEKYLYIRKYWRLFFTFQVIAWTTDVLNIIDIQRDPLWRFYCCILILPIMISRFRCFQHRLYTSTLNFYVRMIRLKIEDSINDIDNSESLARLQHHQQFTMNSKKVFIELNSSMNIFTSIFRMTNLINKMFGFSLLMNVIGNFIQLLSNLFWIYTKLFHQDTENLAG